MSRSEKIERNVRTILSEIPLNVQLVAAVKTRTSDQINNAIDAGINIIGHNYVQEALGVRHSIKKPVKWHFIGHLQKNKVKKVIDIFDLIETVDSIELASEINKRSASLGKIMPIFIEVNSGKEKQKNGVYPEKVIELVKNLGKLENLKVKGIMTMGPFTGDPEEARPYFAETKAVFDKLKECGIPHADICFLSMGMTNSYKIAIEEGANIVRIGTKIFGDRV